MCARLRFSLVRNSKSGRRVKSTFAEFLDINTPDVTIIRPFTCDITNNFAFESERWNAFGAELGKTGGSIKPSSVFVSFAVRLFPAFCFLIIDYPFFLTTCFSGPRPNEQVCVLSYHYNLHLNLFYPNAWKCRCWNPLLVSLFLDFETQNILSSIFWGETVDRTPNRPLKSNTSSQSSGCYLSAALNVCENAERAQWRPASLPRRRSRWPLPLPEPWALEMVLVISINQELVLPRFRFKTERGSLQEARYLQLQTCSFVSWPTAWTLGLKPQLRRPN